MKIPELFDALRKSTSELLGLGAVDDLSPIQSLKVDLASSLRLELDRLMAQQLRGEAVDLRALTVASEMLERLLRPADVVASNDPHAGAREELERFLTQRAEAIERKKEREARAEAERQQLPEPRVLSAEKTTSCTTTQPRVTYVDAAVIDPVPPPPAPAAAQSSDAEWSRWYRAGGGVRQAGWDSIPKGW